MVFRLRLLREEMEKAELQGFLVSKTNNIYYLTGFMSTGGAYLLVTENSDPVLWVSRLEENRGREEARNCNIRIISPGSKMAENLSSEFGKTKIETVGFDDIPVGEYVRLVGDWRGELKEETQLIWKLRRVKDSEEIKTMREAAKLADIGVQAAIDTVAPGVNEFKVAAEAEYAMRIRQSEGTAFETIVASGPRSAFPHGPPTARKIRRHDLIVIDIGATIRHYRSDITRTIAVGKASQKQKNMFETVLEAGEEALFRYKDGEKCSLVDEVARSIIERRGYGKYFVHGLGHGIGLDIHEPPTISPNSKDLLETGCLVSDEPGIYIPSIGGVRIEDMVLVGRDCGERITTTAKGIGF